MSERTDERTAESGDVDVDELLDGIGSGGSGGSGGADAPGPAGFDEDELGVDVEALVGEPDATSRSDGSARSGGAAQGGDSGGSGGSGGSLLGGLSRLRPSFGVGNPLAGLPSGRSVLLSVGVVLVSMIGFALLLPLGNLGGMLGIAVGSFLLGLLGGESRYLELGLSGAVAAAVSTVLGQLFLSAVAGLAVPLFAVGAGGGLAAAVLGHYFGRDLRSGLTRDV